MSLPKVIVLTVPEGSLYDPANKQFTRLCNLLREAGHGWEEFADSARLLDLEAMEKPERDRGFQATFEEGYNTALREVAGV